MGEHIRRRAVLALGAASAVSACSRMTYAVQFSAATPAVTPVLEAVSSFARAHGYQMQDDSEPPLRQYFEGRWSIFWFYQMETGPFRAELRHKVEILFPRDDLAVWLDEFRAAVRQIEGVRIAEGYE